MNPIKNKSFILTAVGLLVVSAGIAVFLYMESPLPGAGVQGNGEFANLDNTATTSAPIILSVASSLSEKNAEILQRRYASTSESLTKELSKKDIGLTDLAVVSGTLCGKNSKIKENVLYSNTVTLLVQEGIEPEAFVKIVSYLDDTSVGKVEAETYLVKELGKEKTTNAMRTFCSATEIQVRLEVDAGIVGLVGERTTAATTTSSTSATQFENMEKLLSPILTKNDTSNDDVKELLSFICKKTLTIETAHTNMIDTLIELRFTKSEITNLFSRLSKGDNLQAAFAYINRSTSYVSAVEKLCR
ncbi:MAG: hypothetical protein AAB628_02950 [Patescibacteria group bacterium]